MKRENRHFTLDAAALEERGLFRQVQYDQNQNAILLDDMQLVEDDAPAIGRPEGAEDRSWFEKLHRGVMIRKELILEDERATAAYLLFGGTEIDYNDAPLHTRLNGHELVRPPTKLAHPFARHYYTHDWGGSHFDNWFVIPVPVGALRRGANELIMWTDAEETSWEVMVAADAEFQRGSEVPRQPPDRSAKSVDGGHTWDSAHLGWKDEIDGEYCIRLSLDRHASKGIYTSPVIDLADENEGIGEALEIETCRASWDFDLPAECRADISLRFGDSPVPDAPSWPTFAAITDHTQTWTSPAGRYLQFRVELGTENPLVTPALKSVSIETEVAQKNPVSTSHHYLMEFRNGRVVRPSFEFVHEDFANLKELRQRFDLDEVVQNATTEFEAQLMLMRWAYKVPIGNLNPYAWNYYDLPQLEKDENGRPLLLGDYPGRRRQGHCLFCNLTLIAACLAMGYPARWVNISTKHTYGHEVTEVWSNEFDKWIFLDATRDYYAFDPATGIPLNLVELSERLAEITPAPATWEFPIEHHLPNDDMLTAAHVAYRQGDNSVPIDNPDEGPHHLILKGHLQMVLRNDFASRSQPLPWRISSNWGSDLFYCYYGDMFPRKREYQRHTRRRQDFNPSLNQAELFPIATADPSVLRVDMDTETPCFETFLMRVDSDPWSPVSDTSLEWRLHEGPNSLRIKTRNTAGVCGPESLLMMAMHS
jgi:hypothetical protein